MAVDKRNDQASTGKESQALRADELENYGVWVKSEPRDVSEFPDDNLQAGISLEDGGLEDIDIDSDVKDESFLSLEEESLLDSFGEEPESTPAEGKRDQKAIDADFSVEDIKEPQKTGGNRGVSEEPLEISLDAFESEDFPEPAVLEPETLENEVFEEGPQIETVNLDEMKFNPDSPNADLQDEFSIPDFSISDSEAVESSLIQENSISNEETFDALLEAEEIDLGDIPAIEHEEELEALEEATPGDQGSGEEEISLEDFGIQVDEMPSSKKSGSKGQSNVTSDVSLDDFVDIETFGVSMNDNPSRDSDEELEPIEMDLDFDDSIDTEPLSMVRERDGAAQSFEDTLGDEAAPSYTGPKIDTEAVTDFDDFLKEDTQPQIVRQAGKQDSSASPRSLDVSGDFIDSGLIEGAAVDDQTGLISDAESVDISMDGSESGGSGRETGPVGQKTSLYDVETDDVLANIENLTDDIPLDAISSTTEDLPDFKFANEDDEKPETKLTAAGTEASESPLAGDFDDIQALELSLTEGEEEVLDKEAVGGAYQASILQKIANELSTIKDELASLKDELSSMRAGAKEAPSPEEPAGKKQKGFFDEEEDETIALTGDELDNILNTADFTEETGAPEAQEAESAAQADSDLEDLIPLDSSSGAPIEKVSLGSQGKPAVAGAQDDRGLEDLKLIHEQGLSPMTEAPDDTSYLEEPIDEELESMTLADTPLEEPDLSNFLVSDEAVLDAGEKPFALTEETESAEEELLDDITLDLDSDSGLSPDILADTPVMPVISSPDEEEDDFLSEISLADDTHLETEELEELPDIDLGEELEPEPKAKAKAVKEKAAKAPSASANAKEEPKALPPNLKNDIKSVLQYMDRLLESLPEDKIEEFAHSEHFSVYKKLFEELGLL